jgi:hypothetical protein
VPVALPVVDEREQVAADDLIALADLVGQHALFFQQRQPRLRPLRVIAGRPLRPVPFGLLFSSCGLRFGVGELLLQLRLILLNRLAGRVWVRVRAGPLPAGLPGRVIFCAALGHPPRVPPQRPVDLPDQRPRRHEPVRGHSRPRHRFPQLPVQLDTHGRNGGPKAGAPTNTTPKLTNG